MKVDFSQIKVKDIEGNETVLDISKDLGNMMYFNDKDIAVADLGYEIYHKKEIELTKEQAKTVAEYVDNGFKAFVKRELLPILRSE